MSDKPQTPATREDFASIGRRAHQKFVEAEDELVKAKFSAEYLLGNPLLMDVICFHISGGGSLTALAEDYGVPFGALSNWVNQDETRRKRYMAAINDRGEYSIEKILQELRAMISFDIRELFNDDGSIKDPSEWSDNISRAVASLKVEELFEGKGEEREQVGYTKFIKFWDKPKSIELLGKTLALFSDRGAVDTEDSLEELIIKSYKLGKEEKDAGAITIEPGDIKQTTNSGRDGGKRVQEEREEGDIADAETEAAKAFYQQQLGADD